MKKFKKSIITISIALLCVVIGTLAFFVIQEKYEFSKMNASNTEEVIPEVLTISNGNVNLYIVKAEEGYVAIDAGVSLAVTERELNSNAINPEEVSVVFLTHSDFDHIAALKLFKNAKVYISEEEVQMINGEKHRRFIFGNKLDSEYSTLKDGEKIKVSNLEVECILTPGHTLGSMSYLVNGELLFVGDTLSLKDGKAELFNKVLNMDNNAQKESIEKLSQLQGAKYIFTGHYGYSDNFNKVFLEK